MQINKMTRKDFEALPHRKWDEEIECDSIIILPTHKKHDSGFRKMDFVAVVKDEPICLLSGCSDVIHFDGIGGFGKDWVKYGGCPDLVVPSGWSIYCLPKSGLLCIFSNNGKIYCDTACSSFEIYVIHEEDK